MFMVPLSWYDFRIFKILLATQFKIRKNILLLPGFALLSLNESIINSLADVVAVAINTTWGILGKMLLRMSNFP